MSTRCCAFRDRFALPLSDEQIATLDFYRPADNSAELVYLRERRRALGGYLPARRRSGASGRRARRSQAYADFALQRRGQGDVDDHGRRPPVQQSSEGRDARSPNRSDRRRRSAHLRHGESVPAGRHLFAVRPALRAGRLRARCSTTRKRRTASFSKRASPKRARSRHGPRPPPPTASHGLAMLPFYIFYSMFGFQRVGDLIWAAADQRARGFLIGATAGRTTLGRRGPAAPGRLEPCDRRDHSQLPRLRPGLRLRNGGDPRPRRPLDDGGGQGRVLLRHSDERELCAAVDAGRRGSRHHQRPLPLRVACRGRTSPVCSSARFGRDPSRK